MKVDIKFDVLLSKEERAEYDHLMARKPQSDSRDALMAVLFMAMVDGEDNIMQLRNNKQKVLATEFGRIGLPALRLDAKIEEFETRWIEKHARLKTAINTVLDTYLQGETK